MFFLREEIGSLEFNPSFKFFVATRQMSILREQNFLAVPDCGVIDRAFSDFNLY